VADVKRKALILPGAGARGAYQVGVLKAIAEILPKRSPNPFAVISGTSAGAINAAVLASRAQNFPNAVAEMESVWSNFSADQVYRTDNHTMLKSSLHWLAAIVFGGLRRWNPESLLDNSPLRELLQKRIHFPRIATAIQRGHLEALAVTASAYTSARSVTFFQSNDQDASWHRVRRVGRPETINVDHLIASSAVPFIFPPVRIGREYYGDGSMRHRAPLSSAIHLGAERLLIIGVRDEHPDPEPTASSEAVPPNLAYLAGYMLDTLFMDGVYADLERLTRINQILEELDAEALPTRHGELRQVQTLLLVPDEDIREVAAHYAHELPRAVRLLLNGLGAMNARGMQLVSYLLFESGFTRELIRLGYEGAMRQEEHLRAFLFDQPMGTLDAPIFLKTEIEH
jgi:NTE family protein